MEQQTTEKAFESLQIIESDAIDVEIKWIEGAYRWSLTPLICNINKIANRWVSFHSTQPTGYISKHHHFS